MSANKHNDSLEQFFREKTENFDLGYDEADWQEMEQRLDQADRIDLLSRQNSLMYKRFAAVAVLLIILSGLAFIIYQNYYRINELESRLSQRQSVEKPGNRFTDQKEQANKKLQPLPTGNNGDNSFIAAQKDKPTTNAQSNSSVNNSLDDKTENATSRNTDNLLNIELVTPLEPAKLRAAVQPAPPSVSKNISFQNDEPMLAAVWGDDSYEASASQAIDIKNINNEVGKTYSGFSLGITAGPDFSTAGSFSDFYTPGYKIGATAAYRFSKKFGVSVGVIYSNVNYTASGSEYTPPQGFWSYSTVPQRTEAACAILSIPLRFKFNFAQMSSSRFYVTAGVSSYIMLNEKYQFDYEQQDESHLVQSWSGQTGTKHWLSNTTFSIGYEFDVSQTMSIGIEPYISIPIKSVGWGNVSLYSTGTLISVHYRFQ